MLFTLVLLPISTCLRKWRNKRINKRRDGGYPSHYSLSSGSARWHEANNKQNERIGLEIGVSDVGGNQFTSPFECKALLFRFIMKMSSFFDWHSVSCLWNSTCRLVKCHRPVIVICHRWILIYASLHFFKEFLPYFGLEYLFENLMTQVRWKYDYVLSIRNR